MSKVLFGFFVILMSTQCLAERTVMFGAGSNSDDGEYSSDSTAWSLGFLSNSTESGYRWGVDIAGEGTMLDSTSNQNEAIDQGFSINLLFGGDVTGNVTAGVLLGAVETSQDCDQQSYLGFQCYADTEPNSDYDFNYGVWGMYKFSGFAVGARISGESQQLTFGIDF